MLCLDGEGSEKKIKVGMGVGSGRFFRVGESAFCKGEKERERERQIERVFAADASGVCLSLKRSTPRSPNQSGACAGSVPRTTNVLSLLCKDSVSVGLRDSRAFYSAPNPTRVHGKKNAPVGRNWEREKWQNSMGGLGNPAENRKNNNRRLT